jgi:septal ring factor EnvC (AmiA/AmiB activator)
MPFTAQALIQARETLIQNAREKRSLLQKVRDFSQKISDLEREVQKHATAATVAQQALANARVEIEALRAQLPDEATRRAFDALTQHLAEPADGYEAMRVAA